MVAVNNEENVNNNEDEVEKQIQVLNDQMMKSILTDLVGIVEVAGLRVVVGVNGSIVLNLTGTLLELLLLNAPEEIAENAAEGADKFVTKLFEVVMKCYKEAGRPLVLQIPGEVK